MNSIPFKSVLTTLGSLTKETRILALIIIANTIIVVTLRDRIPQEHILVMYILSIFLLLTSFYIYYRLSYLPFRFDYDLEGEWSYEGEAEISNREEVVAGKCRIVQRFNTIQLKGVRTQTILDNARCGRCSEKSEVRCNNCGNRDTKNYDWISIWAAVTNDSTLRFDYQFYLEGDTSKRGYCVLDYISQDCNKMTGALFRLPPHKAPGRISFTRITNKNRQISI